jgi:hypothetical protein
MNKPRLTQKTRNTLNGSGLAMRKVRIKLIRSMIACGQWRGGRATRREHILTLRNHGKPTYIVNPPAHAA